MKSTSPRGLHAVSDVLYPVTVLLMEVLWINSWLVWLTAFQGQYWDRIPLEIWEFFIILAGSFFVARYIPERKRVLVWMKLGFVLALSFSIVLIAHGPVGNLSVPFVAALFIGLYFNWQGMKLGRSGLPFSVVSRRFITGLIAFAVLIILWTAGQSSSTVDYASILSTQISIYFAVGLLSLALGNVQAIRLKTAEAGTSLITAKRWIPIQLAAVLLIAVLGFGIASLFSPDFFDFVSAMLRSLFSFASKIFVSILYPFSWLAMKMSRVFEWLINLIRGDRVNTFEAEASFEPLDEMDARNSASPPDIVAVMKWVLFVTAVIVFIAALVKVLKRSRDVRDDASHDEILESLGFWTNLKRDLQLMLRSLLRSRSRKQHERDVGNRTPHREHDAGELEIREIYRRLLREGALIGMGRRLHETPNEYAFRLSAAMPPDDSTLSELTEIYVAHRYGMTEEPSAKHQANDLWRTVLLVLQNLDADFRFPHA